MYPLTNKNELFGKNVRLKYINLIWSSCESWTFVAGCCQRTLVGRVYIILVNSMIIFFKKNTQVHIKAILYKYK